VFRATTIPRRTRGDGYTKKITTGQYSDYVAGANISTITNRGDTPYEIRELGSIILNEISNKIGNIQTFGFYFGIWNDLIESLAALILFAEYWYIGCSISSCITVLKSW